MKILLAGGAGFIGTNLVKRFLKDNKNKITVIDNYCTGSVNNHIKDKRVVYINADICDYRDSESYDYVLNFACPASPVAYQSIPIQTWLTSVQGTYNLIGLAYLCKAKYFHASTSEVYGDPAISPQVEEYWGNVNCYGPRSCYDEGKRAAEALIYDFQRVVNMDAKIIRIFNTYGPYMARNDGRVVSNFIVQALENKPITIYGDGEQTRSFCYVDDTVEAIIRVMSGEYNQPLNVGNPDEFTMLELAEKVLKITGSNSNIVKMPLPIDDPKQRKPNIDKIYNLYDWHPEIKLESGLKRTIKYFKDL